MKAHIVLVHRLTQNVQEGSAFCERFQHSGATSSESSVCVCALAADFRPTLTQAV